MSNLDLAFLANSLGVELAEPTNDETADTAAAVEPVAAVNLAELAGESGAPVAAGGGEPVKADPSSYDPHAAITYVNKRCAWIRSLGCVVYFGDQIDYMGKDSFLTTFNNRKVNWSDGEKTHSKPLGSFWISHRERRTYSHVGLWPPPRVAPVGALNLWQGFAIEPKPGDWSLMREHIRAIIADGDPRLDEYVIRWLAWLFQHPGEQAEVALCLRGRPGTGKGALGNAIMQICSPHSVHVASPELFVDGRFNGHLAQAVFLFVDEALWSGSKRAENKLKAMLTEPSRMVEDKGIRAHPVDNCLHLLIASNEKWIAPVAVGDRRFVIADVADGKKGDREYFGALFAEQRSGGIAAMLHDLLALELGDWHPRELVETAARRDQQELSLGPAEEYALELLDSGVLPWHHRDCGHGQCGSPPPDGVAYSASLERDMRDRIPVLKSRSVRVLSEPLRVIGSERWRSGDRRHRGWAFPSLAEARQRWEAEYFPREWSVDSDDWTHG